MSASDDLRHLAVEERQQKGANVGAIDVGVRHDDDAVVAELREIEVLLDTRTKRGDQDLDLLVLEHFVEPGLLHVEDLAFERQDGLKMPVPALLRGAPRGLTLDDEELGARRIPFLAIRQLSRKRGHVQGTFAAG